MPRLSADPPQTGQGANKVRLIQSHLVVLIVGASLFVALNIAAQWYVRREAVPGDRPRFPHGFRFIRLGLVALLGGTTTLSILVSVTLLALAITRPAICPTWLCLAAVHVPITQADGIHDSQLEAYLITVQSNTSVLTQPVASYTPTTLPVRPETAVAAAQVGAPPTPEDAYRVIIGVHSLLTRSASVVIEDVQFAIDATLPVAYPLNVWKRGATLGYTANPYLSVYAGEPTGTLLSAEYIPTSFAGVQLKPGEADTLAVEMRAIMLSAFRFHVVITYRVADQTQEHLLVLRTPLTVMFSTTANWHPYVLSKGTLVPGT